MTNIKFVSQCVFEKNLLVSFEYANQKSIAQPFDAATELVDKMLFKGEETCKEFLLLLQDANLVAMLPELKTMPWYNSQTCMSSTDTTSNVSNYPTQASHGRFSLL